jgi:hypothetical protein
LDLAAQICRFLVQYFLFYFLNFPFYFICILWCLEIRNKCTQSIVIMYQCLGMYNCTFNPLFKWFIVYCVTVCHVMISWNLLCLKLIERINNI